MEDALQQRKYRTIGAGEALLLTFPFSVSDCREFTLVRKCSGSRLWCSMEAIWNGVAPSIPLCSFGSQEGMKVPTGSCSWAFLTPQVGPEIVWKGVMGPGPSNALS